MNNHHLHGVKRMTTLGFLRGIFVLLIILNIPVNSIGDIQKPFLYEHKLTSFVESKDPAVVGKKQLNFTENDQEIYAWAHYKWLDLTDTDHSIRFDWYTPIGDLYSSSTVNFCECVFDDYLYSKIYVNCSKEKNGSSCIDPNLTLETNLSLHGNWQVNVSLDNEYQYTEKFVFRIEST